MTVKHSRLVRTSRLCNNGRTVDNRTLCYHLYPRNKTFRKVNPFYHCKNAA